MARPLCPVLMRTHGSLSLPSHPVPCLTPPLWAARALARARPIALPPQGIYGCLDVIKDKYECELQGPSSTWR